MNRVTLVNRVVNKPEVRKAVAPGYKNIDLTTFATNPNNLIFGDLDGIVIFAFLTKGVYQMHYLMTRKRRGKKALAFFRRAIDRVFTDHGALAIVGSTPVDNLPARVMNTALGGIPLGVSVDSLGRSCIDYGLERERWVQLSAESWAGLARLSVAAPQAVPTVRQPVKHLQVITT